jgi:shikimate kinase
MLVFIVGPPAVGKMTVGMELARRTGLKLFHNHQTIDLVLPFFAHGTPPFHRLVGEFRRRILEEVAGSDLPGVIFTYVWAFDERADGAVVEEYASLFRANGGRVVFVELQATQAERLRRNETELRLSEKPSKRDVEQSRRRLLAADATYRMSSGGEFDGRADYLRIDNTHLSPEAVADQVIRAFDLPRSGVQTPSDRGDR